MSPQIEIVRGSPQLSCELGQIVTTDYSDLVADIFYGATAKLGYETPPMTENERLEDYFRRVNPDLKSIYELSRKAPIVCLNSYCRVNCTPQLRCEFNTNPRSSTEFSDQLAEMATIEVVNKWLLDLPS